MFRSAWQRRWGLWLLALLLLFPSLPAKAAAATATGWWKTAAYVNLRSQPTQSAPGWVITARVWVEITGESDNWYAVNGPDGKSGWMSKNFIRVEPDVVRAVGIVTNPLERGYLNLRATPSYSAQVLDYYYNGVPCTLQGLNDGWYQVNVNGKTGYFRSEYIRQHSWVASDQVATIQTPNNTGLNLRTGPGTGYTSLRQFKGGKYVMVLQKGNDWWKVSVDGYVGFMSASFLRDGIIKPDFSTGSSTGQNSKGYGIVTNPRSNQVLNLPGECVHDQQGHFPAWERYPGDRSGAGYRMVQGTGGQHGQRRLYDDPVPDAV